MAVDVDWNGIEANPYRILIPRADMTLLQASPEIRELDVDALRHELKDLEALAGGEGMLHPDTHVHTTEVVLSGVVYARFVSIIPPYTVEFEDGQYRVVSVGANHNVADVLVANQVSLITQNSAGLIVVTGGVAADAIAQAVWRRLRSLDTGNPGAYAAVAEWTGVPDPDLVADKVWDEARAGHPTAGTFGATAEWVTTFTPAGLADAVWDEQRGPHGSPGSFGATAEWASTLTEAGIADQVWNESRAGHVIAGSFGSVTEWTGVPSAPPSSGAIADAVWDEARGAHVAAGTFGAVTEYTGVPSAPTIPTAAAIADAVLDEAVADHQVSGSLGWTIQRILDENEADVHVTTGGTVLEIRRRSDNVLLFSKTITGGSTVDVDVEGP